MTDVVLGAHLVGAFTLAGGLAIYLASLTLADGHGGAAARLCGVASPAMTAGTLLVLATGMWMAIDFDLIRQTWLVVALALFFGLIAANRVLVAPRLARTGSAKRAHIGAGLIVAAVFAIAVLMALKPGRLASVLVAAGFLAVGPIAAVARLGRPMPASKEPALE